MTREEAMKRLQAIKSYMTAGNPIWSVEPVGEAFDMAIEALSAEAAQSGDLISRQAAVDAVSNIKRTDNWKAAITLLLLDLPTADRPRGEWIVRDDMPKLDNTYSIECSKCGQLMFGHYNSDDPNFCPNCGADMREANT